MAATIYDVIIPQAADWEDGITVADVSSGNALDLTGYTARLQGREKHGDAAALFTLTETETADGGITLGGVAGTVKWRLRASKTVTLTAPANIVYDLRLVAPDGSVIRPVQGTANVSPAATLP